MQKIENNPISQLLFFAPDGGAETMILAFGVLADGKKHLVGFAPFPREELEATAREFAREPARLQAKLSEAFNDDADAEFLATLSDEERAGIPDSVTLAEAMFMPTSPDNAFAGTVLALATANGLLRLRERAKKGAKKAQKQGAGA